MEIWIIDATTYNKIIPDELLELKRKHFKLKQHTRNRVIGKHLARGSNTYSIGALYITEILCKLGYKAKYFTFEQLKNIVHDESTKSYPEIVAFSAVTPTIKNCSEISSLIKDVCKNTLIILGGPHAILSPVITKNKFPIFDKIIPYSGWAAACTMIGKERCRTQEDTTHFNIYRHLTNDLTSYGHNLISKTGCSFNCQYCQDRLLNSSYPDFENCLSYLSENLPDLSQLHIADSSIGGTTAGACHVCKKFQQISHNFILSCDIRAELVTKPLLLEMTKAGFKEIRIGLDVSDFSVSNQVNRNLNLTSFEKVLKRIRNNTNLYISVYVLSGLPYSTESTIISNCDYIDKLFSDDLVDQIKHHHFVPYPMDNNFDYIDEILDISTNWEEFDRYSFPVYSLKNLNSKQLWESYIYTEKRILESWQNKENLRLTGNIDQSFQGDYHLTNYNIL